MIKILTQIIKLSSDRRKLYYLLKSITGIFPKELEVYELALIHKSAMIKADNGEIINNERLEFLGDAILGAIVAQELYNKYPTVNEGFLTKTRSKIVNRSFLNETALKLGLKDIISSQSRIALEKTNIMGDALEALIGAIFVDQGYKGCQKFITKKILVPYVNLNEITKHDTNFKSILIEWGQKHKHDIQFITDEIPDNCEHAPVFVSSVEVDNKVFGRGEGSSKKESQQNAAMEALQNVSLRKEDLS
ncbi:ribonuclease III [Plebeiibacterium sediminum]|uniref:Ribonuclease 3 n=1 Tax=Plebeiibacterium sediminum TaxID=2992112 RepID=A0AAE3M4J7_9BACT|nr:ribonuclease III [Plebeiobacterium sediminum]MCW3786535.1 ribonuclease III [Plebeiobacterium sediminum]